MGVTQTLLYMTCVCLARDLVSCDNFEETGKDITLNPSIRGHPTDILWKHNGNLVLEYDGSEVLKYGSFTGRVEVDFETGELTIRKLKSQDSGQYQSDIVINEKVQTSTHTVTVLDALPDPQVTCELSESSNASKKLLCSVESQTQPSCEWSGPNINVRSGPELLVDEQEENRDSVYTCTVKNQVNSKSAAFNLKDCPIGRAGSSVLVPVLTVTILLLIFLLLLAILIFIYRRKKRKQERPSKPIEMDPENGEDKNLLERRPTDVTRGSSDATLPSHNRLPHQKESIADKKWEQDNRSDNSMEEQKLFKETTKLLEHNPKQTPQSVSETNQEDKEHGNEGELAKNAKNRESTVEAEEKPYSKPDETEKEDKSLQSQEEEEKESQVMKQGSGNGEKSPEHQNESREDQKTGDDNEDNPTPGETIDRRDAGPEIENPQSAVTERNNMDTEKEEEQLHENEKKSQSDDGEQSPEQQNLNKQRTEDEDDMKPGEQKERNEEEEIDRAEHCNEPAVDNTLDGEAPSAPAAPTEEEPLNSSTSSFNQTGQGNHTHQDKKEEEKCSGMDPDEEATAVTNQEQKDGQKQMAQGKDHDPDKSEGKSSDDFDKQADPDCTINSASPQDEAVKSEKSGMSDKETEVQPQQEEGGQ